MLKSIFFDYYEKKEKFNQNLMQCTKYTNIVSIVVLSLSFSAILFLRIFEKPISSNIVYPIIGMGLSACSLTISLASRALCISFQKPEPPLLAKGP